MVCEIGLFSSNASADKFEIASDSQALRQASNASASKVEIASDSQAFVVLRIAYIIFN